MSFAQPLLLVLLIAVPLLLAAYLWQLRRRRRQAVRHSNVALVRVAAGPVRRWRRHVPIGLVLAALALLGIAAARPQVRADVPVSSATIILALDVSGSMCATDVEPNRLGAAQAAVRSYVEGLDDETKVGFVIFSGFAQLAVPPTTEREALLTELEAVTTGRGTAIGAAILTSIDAIAELDPEVAPSDLVDEPSTDGPGTSDGTTPTPTPAAPPAPSGGERDFAPEIIVLLTDGANTRGVTPAQAAEQASARGVRVYPIGFGTRNPTQMACSRDQIGGFAPPRFGGGFGGGGGGGGGGGRNYLVVDEEALKSVATTTGGAYFGATDADQLGAVLGDLPKHVTVQQRDIDLSAGFAALAAMALLLGLGLSLRWTPLH
ncbi:VWA domain-containing protein [Humibacillus xanthopallidus]|uniref:VWA domain-containing protein n=1 Tax=Humibacillus xanthopallidus TaxID=412689 RepID=UPI00384EDDFB